MKRNFTLILFSCFIHSLFAQLPPESDPHRGMYIDRFVKTFVGSNVVDPTFSILSVDTNSDGVFEKEDAYLNYVCENHITYINMYDMEKVIGTNLTAWNENTKQYEKLEKHFCRFVQKARNEYGVTQVGVIGGAPYVFDSLATLLDRYPVDSTSCECQLDVDVVNVEDEFWGDCNANFPYFISVMDAMYNLKQNYNAAHPNNPIITEAYIALIDHCLTPGVLQSAEIIDGCKNCSPFSGLTNPHPRKIDRILYSFLAKTPTWITFYDINVFENTATFDSTDLHPIFYSEGQLTGGGADFFGPWLASSPINNIFIADDYYYYFWRNYSNAPFGQPQMNNIQPGGSHWFAASHMVGVLEDPMMVQTFAPFCSVNDSVKIDLNYLGPDEAGTDYQFWITRNSDSATVYPQAGGKFSGVSQWTAYNPGQRAINFPDTNIFPALYLPEGDYTTHLNLHYNHSTGCTYSCDFKFIVDDKARIQVAGDTAFCFGAHTFLTTNSGGSSYTWYRNGTLFAANNSNKLKVLEGGDYFCQIVGGDCSSYTDTVHINVHPLPNIEINGTCNANGTITLKTNMLPANASSSETSGPGGVTYQWNTGAITDQITVSSAAKSYRVLITDPYSGCTLKRHITIPNPISSGFTGIITVNQQPSSPCSNDGVLTASLSPYPGIYDPVRVLWSNGSSDTTIYNLSPGTYTVELTYKTWACSFYASVTLGILPTNGPVMNEVITPTSCNNVNSGSIEINPTGGDPPFKFHWDFIPDENGYSSTSQNQYNLYPGLYTVHVEDSLGCEYSHSYSIQESTGKINVSSASVSPVTGCGTNQNGSATVSISGGSSPYQTIWWDNSGQSYSSGNNLHSGSYKVIVTDNSGCTGYTYVHVPTENVSIHVELQDSSTTFTGCDTVHSGSLYFCAHGGVKPFSINPPWAISSSVYALNNLGGGYYPFTITDAMNCSYTDSFHIVSSNIQFTASPSHTTCIGCSNGSIHFAFDGGIEPYSISWTPNNGILNDTIIEQLTAGIYTVCITDSALCQLCLDIEIFDDPLSTIKSEAVGNLTVLPVPSRQYFILHFENPTASNYNLEILDLLGRNVQSQKVFSSVENRINTEKLFNGVYFLVLKDENNSAFSVKQIIVSN